jgi:hypothetical protein
MDVPLLKKQVGVAVPICCFMIEFRVLHFVSRVYFDHVLIRIKRCAVMQGWVPGNMLLESVNPSHQAVQYEAHDDRLQLGQE